MSVRRNRNLFKPGNLYVVFKWNFKDNKSWVEYFTIGTNMIASI